jgi:hypothetical protein
VDDFVSAVDRRGKCHPPLPPSIFIHPIAYSCTDRRWWMYELALMTRGSRGHQWGLELE